MRYDVETAVAAIFADYLQKNASTAAGMVLDAQRCPIVTFFDPMSVDDADRVVIMCPDAETDAPDPGRFMATLDIGIKTLWTQKTVAGDFDKHFQRVKDVRDKLMPADILTRLLPSLPVGLALDFVEPRKKFTTHIAEGGQSKWIYSGTVFQIAGYFLLEG